MSNRRLAFGGFQRKQKSTVGRESKGRLEKKETQAVSFGKQSKGLHCWCTVKTTLVCKVSHLFVMESLLPFSHKMKNLLLDWWPFFFYQRCWFYMDVNVSLSLHETCMCSLTRSWKHVYFEVIRLIGLYSLFISCYKLDEHLCLNSSPYCFRNGYLACSDFHFGCQNKTWCYMIRMHVFYLIVIK